MKLDCLRGILLINGIVDIAIGIGLALIPNRVGRILGYPEMPGFALFLAGGWGVAAVAFGTGRVLASRRKENLRFWAFLGLLEGGLLSLFCLRFYFSGVMEFVQVVLPMAVGGIFGICYAALYPRRSGTQ